MLATQILDKVTLSDNLPSIYPTHKTCSKCHQSKLLCEFGNNKNSKYGVKAACKVCERKRVKLWRLENPDYNKEYYQANKERKSEYNKIWQQVNRERRSKTNKVWYEANRKRSLENNKAWQQNNRDKRRSIEAKRRAAKLKAFPLWARTGEIKERIDAIYREAKDLELFHQTTYHVDHIHPLQSNFVCGLHVPANLRPLVGIENLSKSNSFIPYIENSSEIEIDMVELRQMVKEFLELETFVRMYMYIKTTSFLKLL